MLSVSYRHAPKKPVYLTFQNQCGMGVIVGEENQQWHEGIKKTAAIQR